MTDKNIMTLKERISEKVGESLLELIPKAEWDELVSGQIEHFMRTKAPEIIEGALKELLLASIKTGINSKAHAINWNNVTGQQTNLAVEKIIKEAAPCLFAAMVEPIVTNALQQFHQYLKNNKSGYY